LRPSREIAVPEGPSWFSKHPIAGVTLVFLISALFLLNFFPSSPVAAPGYVVISFSLGLPPIIQLAVGFASIFRSMLFGFGMQNNAKTFILASLLVFPSLGGIALIYVFVVELQSQLSCSGAGCAQGGILTMMLVPISWVGSFLASEMSRLFSRWNWWPSQLKPHFGKFD
jgi:hypothetical protein